MKAFLSYTRVDAAIVAAIEDDLRDLEHSAWYDRDITGGQAWWDAIIEQIRGCDVFFAVLTPAAVESEACAAENGYASALKKRIVPIVCNPEVKLTLLPAHLSQLQVVRYKPQDLQSYKELKKALKNLPEPVALPDPMPSPPPIPLSYLARIREQIESRRELTSAEQSDLLVQTKQGLKKPETRADALDLLRRFRERGDLLARVADEIDEILVRHPQANEAAPPPLPEPPPKKAPRKQPEPVREAEEETRLDQLPAMLDLTRRGSLETVVRHVATNGGSVLLKTGDDRLAIAREGDDLVVAAEFCRWTDLDEKTLKEQGWQTVGKGKRTALGVAVSAVGFATWGMGFGLLAHKGTRDYVLGHTVVKRFSKSESRKAASEILEAIQLLAPNTTTVIVSTDPAQ